MEKTEWNVTLTLDPTQNAALTVLTHAQKYFPLTPMEMTHRRLAIHEAVSNALKYGGTEASLTASGNKGEWHVAIRQKNKIALPDQTDPFRGVALIKRYARETHVSEDGRTLFLLFY